MNKTELVAEVAKNAGLTKVQAEAAVNAAIEAITASLAKEDKVSIFGFGAFEVKSLAARTGINPRTKEKMEISASKRTVFSASKRLKDAINK